MDFERGKDVEEALGLGSKNDAIRITGINYTMDEKLHTIENPKKMEIFLLRLEKGDLPNDPIFGIEKITLYCVEETVHEEMDSEAISRNHRNFSIGNIEDFPKKYSILENRSDYQLIDILGKTVNVYDRYIRIPKLEKLKEIGFSYLIEFDKAEIKVEEAKGKIRKEIGQKEWEMQAKESERQRQIWEKEEKVLLEKSRAEKKKEKKKPKRKKLFG